MKRLNFLFTIFLLGAVSLDASARYKGDLNGDDRVDLADMVYLAKAVKAGSTDTALDLNASGKVDENDLHRLADIIISGSLVEDTGMNVGIGGWDDSGEDFGGTVKAPAFASRSAAETRFYMRNPKNEGDERYSMEFGISEGDEAPAAILFNIRLPREMQFDKSKIVEIDPSIASSHRLYGTPKFIKENKDDEWSECSLRFIILSSDLSALPFSTGRLGRIFYSIGDCWGTPYFVNCQTASSGDGICTDIPECWSDYNGNFKPVDVSSVWFDVSEMNLIEGEEGWIYANIDPWDATDRNLVWTSSDESVATVISEDGSSARVQAHKEGEAIITATAHNGVSATCAIHVEKRFINVSGIFLSQDNLNMIEGGSAVLTATIEPTDATDKTITWSSTDENIVTVNPNGAAATITAIAPGYAEIRAVASNGMMAICQVNVEARVIEVTEIRLDSSSLEMTEGDTAWLNATVYPENATDRTLTWTSTDETVATVSSDGEVKAISAGTATVTATAANGVSASCQVRVNKRFIDVSGIFLSQDNLGIVEGATAVLTATVEPLDATDKTITWSSTDEGIVIVNPNGASATITAIAPGYAEIRAVVSNGLTAICQVNVEARVMEVTEVRLDSSSLEMTEGDTAWLNATVYPENATDRTLTWTSSDESVATVSSDGEVKAISAGTATVTATAANGVSASCQVRVNKRFIDVSGIFLSQDNLSIVEGATAVLTATVEPSDATDKTITWSSSDEGIAIVNPNGAAATITAIAPGYAEIRAVASNGMTAICQVNVVARVIEVTEIRLDSSSLEMTEGDTAWLNATVYPENATDRMLTWTSSDESVATVSSDGEVKAISAGTATITATATNGVSASCEVTVIAKEIEMRSIILDAEELTLTVGDTHQFVATIVPTDATYQELEWWVDDETIATIDQTGFVTMTGAGETTVHVRSIRWNNVEATCRLNVSSGVATILSEDSTCDTYTIDGRCLKKGVKISEIENLDSGIYIIRQKGQTIKITK